MIICRSSLSTQGREFWIGASIGRPSPSNAYNSGKRGSTGGGSTTNHSGGTNTAITTGFGGEAFGKGYQVPQLFFKSKAYLS